MVLDFTMVGLATGGDVGAIVVLVRVGTGTSGSGFEGFAFFAAVEDTTAWDLPMT
jgi:hypothetical protein